MSQEQANKLWLKVFQVLILVFFSLCAYSLLFLGPGMFFLFWANGLTRGMQLRVVRNSLVEAIKKGKE